MKQVKTPPIVNMAADSEVIVELWLFARAISYSSVRAFAGDIGFLSAEMTQVRPIQPISAGSIHFKTYDTSQETQTQKKYQFSRCLLR